jgi:hypothetical protein
MFLWNICTHLPDFTVLREPTTSKKLVPTYKSVRCHNMNINRGEYFISQVRFTFQFYCQPEHCVLHCNKRCIGAPLYLYHIIIQTFGSWMLQRRVPCLTDAGTGDGCTGLGRRPLGTSHLAQVWLLLLLLLISHNDNFGMTNTKTSSIIFHIYKKYITFK